MGWNCLSVNMKLDSLWTHLEAMSFSLWPQYNRTLTLISSSQRDVMSLFLSMLTNLCSLLLWKRSHFPFRVATTKLGTMSPYSPQATSITETTVVNCVYLSWKVVPILTAIYHTRIVFFISCYYVSDAKSSYMPSSAGSMHLLEVCHPSSEVCTPVRRMQPRKYAPCWKYAPPEVCTPTGQPVGGTHPTGMHPCIK